MFDYIVIGGGAYGTSFSHRMLTSRMYFWRKLLANYTDPSTGINYGDVNGLKRDIDRGTLTMNWNFGAGYTLTAQSAAAQASQVRAPMWW